MIDIQQKKIQKDIEDEEKSMELKKKDEKINYLRKM